MATVGRKKRQAAESAQVKISACTIAENELRETSRDNSSDSSSSASLNVEMSQTLEESENLNEVIEKDATAELSEQQINETNSCNRVDQDPPLQEDKMIGDREQGNNDHEINGEISHATTSQSSDPLKGNPM
jgi:hypothetical protein